MNAGDPENPELRIAIGLPGEEQKMETTGSLLDMLWHFSHANIQTKNGPVKKSYKAICMEGSLLPVLRNDIVRHAVEWNATHLLFVDSDMMFPADALVNLLMHDKLVVGCNYVRRKLPTVPTAYRKDRTGPLFTTPESTGLVEVSHLGTGLVLIDMRAIDKLSEENLCWFSFDRIEDKEHPERSGLRMMGEDVWFCRRLEEAGIPVYVDQDLSKKVRHIGKIQFIHQMAEDTAEKSAA